MPNSKPTGEWLQRLDLACKLDPEESVLTIKQSSTVVNNVTELVVKLMRTNMLLDRASRQQVELGRA